MVSNIVPGVTGANVLGVDPRLTRPAAPAPERRDQAGQGDRVELSAASLSLARESVRDAVSQLHQAIALGQEAQALRVQIEAATRDGNSEALADLDTLLANFAERVESAISGGARLVAGETLQVQAEPGAEPVAISGADLRPDAGASSEAVGEAVGRWLDAVKALEAHQGFLSALERASGVRTDLDADGARLMALQVRQGMEAAGVGAIANVEPQAVLSLFRA